MKGTTDEESVKVEKQQSTDTEPGEMKVGLLDKLKEIPPTKDKVCKQNKYNWREFSLKLCMVEVLQSF